MFGFIVALVTNKTVIAAATAASLWLWNKLRGEKQQSLKDLATGFARQAVAELVGQPDAASKAAEYIEAKIIDGANKLGIPSSVLAAAQPIIDPIVQHAVADVLAQIQQRAAAQAAATAQMQEHLAALAHYVSTFGSDFARAQVAGHDAGKAIADEFAETTVIDAQAPVGATP